MGLLNAMTFSVAMIAVMKKEWNELRDKEGITGCDVKSSHFSRAFSKR
jgi:hypothetical protein